MVDVDLDPAIPNANLGPARIPGQFKDLQFVPGVFHGL